jgi:hypothetical protein
MRVRYLRSIAALSLSAVVVVAALAASTDASQAQRGPNISVGPRGPSAFRSPNISGGGLRTEPRFQRLKDRTDKVVITDDNKAKGGDNRRRPHKRPIVGTGVVVGTGIVVGTGVAAGAPGGPAGAGPGAGGPPGGPVNARIYLPPPGENRFVKDEVMLVFAGNFPAAGIAQVLRRRGLAQLEAQFIALTNTTMVRARVPQGRSVRTALQSLAGEATVQFAQPHMIFTGAQSAAPEPSKVTPAVAAAAAQPSRGDPAQYAIAKLRLGEAHGLADGDRVLIAVIDSGIDMSHPDLAGAFAGSFDAIGKTEPPHPHGTAIAGAIVAHARLLGVAPGAKLLAIRAFSGKGTGSEATGMAILKGIDYAARQQARILNMSFAGPLDPSIARALAAVAVRGAALIAASGNFGPKSPPQYPAFDPNVIAVSATDADDKMFTAANIGPHIAVSAPGVDILLPSPGNDYRLISGTSFAAAHVSGIVALMIQRSPGLKPEAVRKALQETARDLGPLGKDPEYGAGLVDAYRAIVAVQPPTTASAPPQPARDEAKAQ